MGLLVYRCPHCGATHQVDESLIGDRVHCRQCNRPFEAAMPIARPVEAGEVEKPEFLVEAGEGDVEEILIQAHPAMARRHPFRFLGLCLLIAVGLAAVVAGLVGRGQGIGDAPPQVLLIAGLVLAGAGALYLLGWWGETRFTTLKVTGRRTILRRGFFSRRTSEVRHRDVRNLHVHQSKLERLFGVGDLAIISSGDRKEIEVEGIPDPQRIARVIRDMQ
jgi:hypothetical protein